MDRQSLRGELQTILVIVDQKFKGRTDVVDETPLREGLGLDSLQVTEMLFEIEDRLGVKIADEEAMKLRTVGDLITVIETKKAE